MTLQRLNVDQVISSLKPDQENEKKIELLLKAPDNFSNTYAVNTTAYFHDIFTGNTIEGRIVAPYQIRGTKLESWSEHLVGADHHFIIDPDTYQEEDYVLIYLLILGEQFYWVEDQFLSLDGFEEEEDSESLRLDADDLETEYAVASFSNFDIVSWLINSDEDETLFQGLGIIEGDGFWVHSAEYYDQWKTDWLYERIGEGVLFTNPSIDSFPCFCYQVLDISNKTHDPLLQRMIFVEDDLQKVSGLSLADGEGLIKGVVEKSHACETRSYWTNKDLFDFRLKCLLERVSVKDNYPAYLVGDAVKVFYYSDNTEGISLDGWTHSEALVNLGFHLGNNAEAFRYLLYMDKADAVAVDWEAIREQRRKGNFDIWVYGCIIPEFSRKVPFSDERLLHLFVPETSLRVETPAGIGNDHYQLRLSVGTIQQESYTDLTTPTEVCFHESFLTDQYRSSNVLENFN